MASWASGEACSRCHRRWRYGGRLSRYLYRAAWLSRDAHRTASKEEKHLTVGKCFVPGLENDPAAAERVWRERYDSSGEARRLFRLVYKHEGKRFELEVGKRRRMAEYRKARRIKEFPYYSEPMPLRTEETGTIVSAIVDHPAHPVIDVWSFGPPFGGWANPSMVGRNEVIPSEEFYPP